MEIDARFRYYFQHPWSRMVVAYLVTFCNFLIFAEDPISHSQTQTHMAVVGNCFSFLFNKYPGGGWNAVKVVCWILAIITGLLAGKFIFHRRLFSELRGRGMCVCVCVCVGVCVSVFLGGVIPKLNRERVLLCVSVVLVGLSTQ